MNKEECVKKIKKCISYLESFGYQWAVEQAEELKQVAEFIEDTVPDSIDVSKFINMQTREIDIMGYTAEYLENERRRAKRKYEKAYKKAVERAKYVKGS